MAFEDDPDAEEVGVILRENHFLNRYAVTLDEKVLICEGKCNPDIYEYDSLVEQSNSGHHFELKGYLVERVRSLVHTLHISTKGMFWHRGGGWCRNYECQVCKHIRRF